jgi:hypothetical protein
MTRVQRLAMFLEAHFGEVEFHQPEEEGNRSADSEEGERSDDEEASLLVRLDEADARISLISLVSGFFVFPLVWLSKLRILIVSFLSDSGICFYWLFFFSFHLLVGFRFPCYLFLFLVY